MQWLLGCALAGMVCVARLSADTVVEKTTKLPRSHVQAVDFTNMTFTVVVHETNLTVRITSETRFFLYGKPAISKDIEVADHVSGTVRQADEGLPEALRIQIEKLAPK